MKAWRNRSFSDPQITSIDFTDVGRTAATMDEVRLLLPKLNSNMLSCKQAAFGFQCTIDVNAVFYVDAAIAGSDSDELMAFWHDFKTTLAFGTDTLRPPPQVRSALEAICNAFSRVTYGRVRPLDRILRTLYNGVNLQRHPEIARLVGCGYSSTLGTPSNKKLWATVRDGPALLGDADAGASAGASKKRGPATVSREQTAVKRVRAS